MTGVLEQAPILTLELLANQNHPYYASNINWCCAEYHGDWKTFKDFLDEFHDANPHMNFVYRWDIEKNEEELLAEEDLGKYSAHLFMINQRKGIYIPHRIRHMEESDIVPFLNYLNQFRLIIEKFWVINLTGE